MSTRKLPSVRPGEILLEEFLRPMELSQNQRALALGVPPPDGSTRSSWGSGASPLTRPCGWAGTSACLPISGSVSRWTTSWTWSRIGWPTVWMPRCARVARWASILDNCRSPAGKACSYRNPSTGLVRAAHIAAIAAVVAPKTLQMPISILRVHAVRLCAVLPDAHSHCSAVTGFVRAARTAWLLTVRRATASPSPPARRKKPQPSWTR